MRELSHRIHGHETQDIQVSAEGLMLLSSYDKKQEEEADWLSGCLLPRDALVAIKNRSLDLSDAAQIFGVSLRMLKYRLAMTGGKPAIRIKSMLLEYSFKLAICDCIPLMIIFLSNMKGAINI
jgi:hypothetical protein